MILLDCAVHIANIEIRELDRGDHIAAAKAHDRLIDVIDRADDPDMLLLCLAKKLGRKRAARVMIEDEVVDLAIAMARNGELAA